MSVGSLLSEARAASGLDLDEVSARTRVRAALLRDMENDDFSHLGGAVYVRGHLRAYAQALHLDPAPLLEAYDREHGHDDVPVLAPVAARDHEEVVALREPRRLSWTAAGVAAAAIAAVVGVVAYIEGPGGSGDGGGSPTQAAPAPAGQTSPVPSTSPSTPPPAPSPVVPSGVDVVVRAVSGPSWVGVLPGYKVQVVLQKGQSREFKDAQQVDLRIGNPGAVELVVNGQPLGVAGSTTPIDRTFRAAGLSSAATTTN